MHKLTKKFYLNGDVVDIARSLIGKILFTNIGNERTAGRIIETEAYRGYDDMACHACRFGKTQRNEAMFYEGGICYVYLCYGIHHLFNIVTNTENKADAVLIRSIVPIIGIDIMEKRVHNNKKLPLKTNGPGKLTKALGINTSFNTYSLLENIIWIEEDNFFIDGGQIVATERIGVEYAGKHARYKWRFLLNAQEEK
ncbi:MAG: DNA-3-methyladenine glycosylase [Chitinophagaceae bacterium]|nr:DNA-3-methyladenine glycosylase [Chitinophagaceae bacterium]